MKKLKEHLKTFAEDATTKDFEKVLKDLEENEEEVHSLLWKIPKTLKNTLCREHLPGRQAPLKGQI